MFSRCVVHRVSCATRSAAKLRRSLATEASPAYVAPSTGSNPAYDQALKLIAKDKEYRYSMLKKVDKELARVKKANNSVTQSQQLSRLQQLATDLKVKAELNEPEVQWRFQNGFRDMSQPVYRYMVQREFQKHQKSKLLERLLQMRICPDILEQFDPAAQVVINYGNQSVQEAGIFLQPGDTIEPPSVSFINFHEETKLYTILMIDPDVPDQERQAYQQQCLWLATNVPLSTTQPIANGGDTVVPYTPPHPQKGTKYHRYTTVILEQPNGKIELSPSIESKRFDTRQLIQQHQLVPRGISFFREVWDEDVSRIYTDILKEREPIYGKPPKAKRDPNDTSRKTQKYLLL
ncbi:mitochondrial 54S ribosomal protein YmL35 [Umbelopsis sp. WA50703]